MIFRSGVLSGLAMPLFTVHFTHFVQGKDKNMETTKGLITLVTVFFIPLPLTRLNPTRNKTDLYLQIANTLTDLNTTNLPARVMPFPAVL